MFFSSVSHGKRPGIKLPLMKLEQGAATAAAARLKLNEFKVNTIRERGCGQNPQEASV